MKNLFAKAVLMIGFFGLISFSAKADIIVQGKAVSSTHEDGNTYITCKKKNAECIRIVTGTIVVNFDDGTQVMYTSYDGIEILSETETEIEVVLYGAH